MTGNAFVSPEYLATAFLVVLAPGTGVIYTLSIGVLHGARASVAAALGCTFGIVPSLTASALGLATLLHTSVIAFQIVKILGIAYLLYLAWDMWRGSGTLPTSSDAEAEPDQKSGWSWATIAVRGAAINILNPKLALFFTAFLPQFIPVNATDFVTRFAVLSGIFMILTFVVFVGYGMLASGIRHRVLSSARATRWIQRTFAAAFAAFAARLAVTER
ncbi:LysE family translocator [Bauldia sp.]|uniref:LysE family translocator n=1 Tax=Bauldia sp. TaxID=2575872 RepID=UPI003BABE418